MKKQKNTVTGNDLKLETFKVMEMPHPEKIQGGDAGWTVRQDKDRNR
ncbi:hypothetical protein [Flagellimonas nanhaiensis]|nr:hypothetical protein [Allomuricauda nanhaiensis]